MSFSYARGSYARGKQEALSDVSLTVRTGECLVILGANGSGKSTLLKVLDALYFPHRGTVRAFGEVVSEKTMQDEACAFAFRRRVGLVFQDSDVQLFSPTVWDEVTFAPLHLGLPRGEVVDRAEQALAALGIESLRDRTPHRLSGGEKKKVALASVLSLRPDVWLLDEPSADLDPRSEGRLLDLLGRLRRDGRTLVVATHSLDIAREIADRAVVLSEAHRVVAGGAPDAVLSDDECLIECNLIRGRETPASKATPQR